MDERVATGEGDAVAIVAAADDARDGHARLHARLDHVEVTLVDVGVAQLEVAEGVALPHVDTRIVEDEVGLMAREHAGESGAQLPHVAGAVGAAREVHIQVGRLLAKGEVRTAVCGARWPIGGGNRRVSRDAGEAPGRDGWVGRLVWLVPLRGTHGSSA